MADNGNKERRVEMKALEQKIDNLSLNLEKAIARWDKSAEQVIQSQINIAQIKTSQDNMCNDIVSLETKVNGWSSINSIGVVFAAIVASIGAWLSNK
jgi:hypothetical protein